MAIGEGGLTAVKAAAYNPKRQENRNLGEPAVSEVVLCKHGWEEVAQGC